MAEIFSKKKEPFLVTTGLFFSITVQIESLIYKSLGITFPFNGIISYSISLPFHILSREEYVKAKLAYSVE